MNIRVEQESTYTGNNRWDWQIWLSGPAEDLDQIDHVTYTLHPSFPNPVREVNSRDDGFMLKSNGWGEFKIFLELVRKDGSSDILSHALQLKLPTETENAEIMAPSSTVSSTSLTRARTMDRIASETKTRPDTLATAVMPVRTVFISGGIADSEAIDLLKESLRARNVRILGADDVPFGVPFGAHVERLIGQADLAAFIVSGRPSRWVTQEIALAQRYGKRIVPVLIGEGGQLPDSLSALQSLRLDNVDAISDVADSMLAAADSMSMKPRFRP